MRIVARLKHLGGEVYLYGSSVVAFQDGHDIDLLFVLPEEHHQWIYEAIAAIQGDCPLPLHPTVVTPLEFESNPRIRELSESGLRLW